MNSLSNLPALGSTALQTGSAAPRNLVPARNSDSPLQAPQKTNALAERVSQLGRNTVDLAQQLLGSFAQNLFGDAAKGMKVEFDSFALSAESTASAAAYRSESAYGSTAAAAFRLEDASSFTGRGKLTTADGQVFEFEIEVRYQSIQESAFATTSRNTQAGLGKNNGGSEALPAADQDKAATPALDNLRSQFAGIASELLDSLSAEPVRQPFSMSIPNDGQEPLRRLGDLALKLLDLPGGPRHVDLGRLGNDEKPANGRLDAAA